MPMFRSAPEGPGYDIGLRGGYTKVRIDEILLDVAPEEPEVVILFRDIEKPEHLYRLRMEATEPEGELFDASIWAGIIWANFVESIEGGPGMTGGSPARTMEIDW
ncbi:MAG: hypothetical protein ACR2KW_06605 [Rubrobacter sp.]